MTTFDRSGNDPIDTVLLVGCGRMGGALARGWTGRHRVLILDPHAATVPGTQRLDAIDLSAIPAEAVVVLAVKPQSFGTVAPALAPLAARGALFVSIMAGTTLATIGARLDGHRRVVRAMPNTPAAIGRGITAVVADPSVTEGDRERVDGLLRAAGEVLWLDDERDLDLATAVSGSGPAFLFRFVEALAHAGMEAGLAPEVAMRLARATFVGAAALAEQSTDDLATLRAEVTSPGGTTAAGLAAMESGINGMLRPVVRAAASRSRELAGEYGSARTLHAIDDSSSTPKSSIRSGAI